MSIAKTLAIRAITLLGVLFAVLILVAVTLGATGFSDRMLTAIVNEEVGDCGRASPRPSETLIRSSRPSRTTAGSLRLPTSLTGPGTSACPR